MSVQVMNDASNLDEQKKQLIKDVFCKGLSDDEVSIFTYVCAKTGLDPVARQIHPVKRWDGNLKRETMTIQTGIDGYRLIAERTGRYCPGKKSTYDYDKDGRLIAATSYVKKMTRDGTWHEVSESALYSEYVATKKDGSINSMWQTKPHIMLSKCAEALALRRAFPNELSGIYTKEEMGQADNPIVINAAPVAKTTLIAQTIDDEQIMQLKEVFSKCSEEYKKRAWSSWKSQFKIEKIEDLPLEEYDSIMEGALNHLTELAKERQQELLTAMEGE